MTVMEPFNIRINVQGEDVTLTILPYQSNAFKVIYYGGILGAVKRNRRHWEIIAAEEVPAGELPLFEPHRQHEEIELELSGELAISVGKAIDTHLS